MTVNPQTAIRYKTEHHGYENGTKECSLAKSMMFLEGANGQHQKSLCIAAGGSAASKAYNLCVSGANTNVCIFFEQEYEYKGEGLTAYGLAIRGTPEDQDDANQAVWATMMNVPVGKGTHDQGRHVARATGKLTADKVDFKSEVPGVPIKRVKGNAVPRNGRGGKAKSDPRRLPLVLFHPCFRDGNPPPTNGNFTFWDFEKRMVKKKNWDKPRPFPKDKLWLEPTEADS